MGVNDSIIPLSYSGAQRLLACPRKQKYRQLKVDEDWDYIKPPYFEAGTVLHQLIEEHTHGLDDFVSGMCEALSEAPPSYWHLWQSLAMFCVYKKSDYNPRFSSKVSQTFCEVPIRTYKPDYYGIVDMVIVYETGKWFIRDFKTASGMRWGSREIELEERSNQQLAVYGTRYEAVSEKLGLEPQDFLGVEYVGFKKPNKPYKIETSFFQYFNRVEKDIEIKVVFVKKEDLKSEAADLLIDFAAYLDRKIQGLDVNDVPCNFKACFNYGQCCEYFSKCHGEVATKFFTAKR